MRFQVRRELSGWFCRICRAKCTLNRRKSINSHAESISACWTDFDWPSIVAAFNVSRHVVDNRSAARRKIAARSSNGRSRHAAAAPKAASTASATSSVVA